MGRTTFVLRQLAYLKLYMLQKAEKGNLHGFRIMEELTEHFKDLGYKPLKSEIYKALHELLKEGLIKRKWVDKTEMQEIAIYQLDDLEKVKAYKRTVKADLDRSVSLLNRALEDNYSQKEKTGL